MVNEPDEGISPAQPSPGKKAKPRKKSSVSSPPPDRDLLSPSQPLTAADASPKEIQETLDLKPSVAVPELGEVAKVSASEMETIPRDPSQPSSGPPPENVEVRQGGDPSTQDASQGHEFDHYHGAYHGTIESGERHAPDHGPDDSYHHGHDLQVEDIDRHAQDDDEVERERRRQHDRERARVGWKAAGADEEEPAAEAVVEDEEEGGGPVKSFLEHLEDLRWTIIRCVVALVVGMVVCLVAANKVVEWLKLPLAKAQMMAGKPKTQVVMFSIGTNEWQVPTLTNQLGPIRLGTNPGVRLVLEPVLVGTNMVLGVTPHPLKEEEIQSQSHIQIINLGPISPFAVAMKIALWGGIGLASPFMLFFIGTFVMPALKKVEKKYLLRALGIGTVLFCSGVAFCYVFMLSLALNASVQFSTWMSFGAEQWRAEEYIGFVIKFLLGMGLGFELPVLLLTLVKIGLLDYQRLTAYRAYFVVAILVVSAILTPPDPFSMIMMAIPLQVLYELSVFIAWIWYKKEKRLEAEAEAVE